MRQVIIIYAKCTSLGGWGLAKVRPNWPKDNSTYNYYIQSCKSMMKSDYARQKKNAKSIPQR